MTAKKIHLLTLFLGEIVPSGAATIYIPTLLFIKNAQYDSIFMYTTTLCALLFIGGIIAFIIQVRRSESCHEESWRNGNKWIKENPIMSAGLALVLLGFVLMPWIIMAFFK